MVAYHYGNSLGVAVSLRQAKTSTANHHNISSPGIHPLRGFKFYFQIHSDLLPKSGSCLGGTGNWKQLSSFMRISRAQPKHTLKSSRGLQHQPQSNFLTSVPVGRKHELINYKRSSREMGTSAGAVHSCNNKKTTKEGKDIKVSKTGKAGFKTQEVSTMSSPCL